jgi:4-alpha-glucanotransferase
MSADAWGVSHGYADGAGTWIPASNEVRNVVRTAMGAPNDSNDPTGPTETRAVIVVTPARPFTAPVSGTLHFEQGGSVALSVGAALPPDTPLGYHSFTPSGAGDHRRVSVIVSPGTCVLPNNLHTWGWAVQLYAMRSQNSWGIGDFADLRTLTSWSGKRGAGMVLVNPLHAPSPVISQQPSPYFPSSRVYRNPLYLAVEELGGFADIAATVEPELTRAKGLNSDRRIDRDEVFRSKYAVLNLLWHRWNERPSPEHRKFAEYKRAEGQALIDYATFSTYVEAHPSSWFDWPENMKRPNASGVSAYREANADRVEFHSWVQWLVDEQLSTATSGIALMTDLAIGVDRGGADGWMWQDTFALGMSVGAPPDAFNTQGQNWGLPPFDPWKLRDHAYEPFIRTVRSAFRHAGALRMDHVMGLFRLYWIPLGSSAKDGCYVYLPFADLLAIVALESSRAGAYVVGEDLGTIEPYVREELSKFAILSYRLSQFEPGPASEFPVRALAAVTTHDLTTIAGAWTGSDLNDQASIGVSPNVEGMKAVRTDLARRAGFNNIAELGETPSEANDDPSIDEVVFGVYRDLATSPSMLLTATLDDALGVLERPNMPGTIDEWPNWRIALPVSLETALNDPRVEAIATLLNR